MPDRFCKSFMVNAFMLLKTDLTGKCLQLAAFFLNKPYNKSKCPCKRMLNKQGEKKKEGW